MKLFLILTVIFLPTSVLTYAQSDLSQKDVTNLVAISQLYSQNPNAAGDKFSQEVSALRTPALDHIVDTLIETGKGRSTILESRFLARPSDTELKLWYVIREIHYNRRSDSKTPRPDIAVANEILAKTIDSRWLLDNYYYRVHGGIASLFNDADLSKYDLNIEKLGFKNKTEKAIFFLNMMDALAGGRFKVLSFMKNNAKIMEFCSRLPKFNGKEYFYYTDFDYEDFEWIGYEKTESYNERHLGDLYSTLMVHINAIAATRGQTAARDVYVNSIMHEPKYFRFSSSKDILQSLYDKSK